jgi:hypothetical protein
MRRRIALGAGLLLTLGSAVAGTMIYGQAKTTMLEAVEQRSVDPTNVEVTPEMIAMWRATASSSDYMAPKVPL